MTELRRSFTDRLVSVAASAGASDPAAGAVLLADFLACASAGSASDSWFTDLIDVRRVDLSAPAEAAATAHRQDRDDVHWETLVHCGSIIWPVVLATGSATRATGPELTAAAAAGYEAMVRLARFLGTEHRRGFHTTATAGTVGAAAAAAVLYGLATDGIADALGHAISVMGGSAQTMRERSGTRLFHRSHAVRSGLAAAEAAARGLPATVRGLEQLHGDRSDLLDAAVPAMSTASVRIFPASGWNQTAYEAALTARARVEGPVRRVCAEVSAVVAEASSGPDAPVEDRGWSLEHSIASALGDSTGESARRVQVRTGTEDPLETHVEVITDSARGSARIRLPLGHPQRRVSPAALQPKWQSQIGTGAEGLYERCAELLGSRTPDYAALLVTTSQEST